MEKAIGFRDGFGDRLAGLGKIGFDNRYRRIYGPRMGYLRHATHDRADLMAASQGLLDRRLAEKTGRARDTHPQTAHGIGSMVRQFVSIFLAPPHWPAD